SAGSVVDLDGTATDVTYEWKSGTTVLGTDATLTLNHALADALNDGSVTKTASHTDAHTHHDTATKTITVTDVDQAPGSVTVNDGRSSHSSPARRSSDLSAGSVVDLDGTATDVTYEWKSGTTVLGTDATLTLNHALADALNDG